VPKLGHFGAPFWFGHFREYSGLSTRMPSFCRNKQAIFFALFKKTSSLECKYPAKFSPPFSIKMLAFSYTIVSLVYLHCFHRTKPENVQIQCCLDKWKVGIQKHIFFNSYTYDCVYNTILEINIILFFISIVTSRNFVESTGRPQVKFIWSLDGLYLEFRWSSPGPQVYLV
jgi:hypothetical protein